MVRENEEEHFPSEEFAIHTGMKWITVKWKLPVSVKKAGSILREYDIDEVSDFYNKILKLNPSLKPLAGRKTIREKYTISMGVLSRFNLDDIEFFCDRKINIVLCNASNRRSKSVIEKKAGISTQWVMSPRTLSRVFEELNITYEELLKS